MVADFDENTPLLQSPHHCCCHGDESPPQSYAKPKKHLWLWISGAAIVTLAIGASVGIWYFLQHTSSQSGPVAKTEPDLQSLLHDRWPRPDFNVSTGSTEPIITLIRQAVEKGKQQFNSGNANETETEPRALGGPSYEHQSAIVNSPTANEISDKGQIEVEASKYLKSKGVNNVVPYGSAKDLKWANESGCDRLEQISCNVTAYRSVDGTCNNLNHSKTWGVAMIAFRRPLPAEYEDGVSVPRGGFNSSLPPASEVSTRVHRAVHEVDANFTVMLAVWGQFIDHDISATASSRGANGTRISCCQVEKEHPECFPILLSPEDEYYKNHNVTCMEFVRSAPALNCYFGPREQLNQASSYLDGSMVYGNTEELAKRLRTFNDGKLATSNTKDGRALLPVSTDPADGCNEEDEIKKGRYCFLAGDSRANENSELTSMHLIFVRHHNKVANELRELNPSWDDEKVYQEAKRIVTAQIQHITYNEFLPSILGDDMMKALKLNPQEVGYWTGYNDSVNPTISNNFAASSFGFAHTSIPRMLKILANDTSSPEYVEMHKMLFTPFSQYDGELDSLIRGALNSSLGKAEELFNVKVTKRLFAHERIGNRNVTYGLDLVSMSIQRGRDHGLAGYTKWREYCGLATVNSFEDLQPIIDQESLDIISKLYASVEDIDLYTGSLSETPIAGGLVGPTLTCLIADQFYRLKYGDRYWYETNELPQAFTPEQLEEIRKTTLAGIICQNADDLKKIAPNVMRSTHQGNEPILCYEVITPNLSAWNASTKTEIPESSEKSGDKKVYDSPALAKEHETAFGEKNVTSAPTEQKSKPSSNYETILKKIHSKPSNEVNSASLENNILAKITRSEVPLVESDSLSQAERELVEHLPDSEAIENEIPQFSAPTEKITRIEISPENVEIKHDDSSASSFPVKLDENKLKDDVITWNYNPSTRGFEAKDKTGEFRVKYKNIEPKEAPLKENCKYYSRLLFENPENYSNIFEINTTAVPEECTIIAPLRLHGNVSDAGTFLWNGTSTLFVRSQRTALSKEDELSLHKNHNVFLNAKNINGVLSLSNKVIWNGALPALFDVNNLGWPSTNHTIVYPVFWSGNYDGSDFEGNFLIIQKSYTGYLSWDGLFKIDVSSVKNVKEVIHPYRVYQSIVYLTENTIFDVPEFNEIEDWDPRSTSRIILTGKFEANKFFWTGDVTFVPPKNPPVDPPASSYRPHGKYLIELKQGTLLASLGNANPILKWWSGELPSAAIIPATLHDQKMYTVLFDEAITWSYVPSDAFFGKAEFRTYGKESKIFLFGDFEFNVTNFFESIWTVELQPNVTYYSPLILQENKIAHDVGSDLVEIYYDLRKPEAGVFAPIMLLGEYVGTNRELFQWNFNGIVTIEE